MVQHFYPTKVLKCEAPNRVRNLMITFTPEYWSMSLYMGGLIHGRAYIRAERRTLLRTRVDLYTEGLILEKAYIRNSTVKKQCVIGHKHCLLTITGNEDCWAEKKIVLLAGELAQCLVPHNLQTLNSAVMPWTRYSLSHISLELTGFQLSIPYAFW
jgi:hypothetical protein